MSHSISPRRRLSPFLHSGWFSALIFLCAVWVVIAQAPIRGAVCFVLLISALLMLSEDTALTLLPFSLLCMFVLKEYDSYDRFIRLWWLALPLSAAVIFHLIAYWEKPKKGLLLYGIAAVAVAVTLGGLGSISKAEYFTGSNLYYVSGLGLGMVLMHLLVSAKYRDRDGFPIRERVCGVFYLVGLFGVFMLSHHIYCSWDSICQTGQIPSIQWSNNLSTFLMIALPFGFYYSSRHFLHLIPTHLMLAAMMLSGSRAPLIFGVIEYLLCVAVFTAIDRRRWYVYLVPLALITALVVKNHEPIREYFLRIMELDNLDREPRYRMALRAWDEFRADPIFGSGLGSTGRQDIYAPVKFAMNWYHSAPFQIMASLGVLGIVAYCFQWFTRIRAFLAEHSVFGWTVFLSSAGLFLMSLVNPGFFCPFPYEFFMVMLFAVLANTTTYSQ